jgi:hypothetical protein
MTTTAKTTAADTILAIDLGKYKSVAQCELGGLGLAVAPTIGGFGIIGERSQGVSTPRNCMR